MAKKKHKDVEFEVSGKGFSRRVFDTFDEAAGYAVGASQYHEENVTLDVLVYSRAGAKWWLGDDGVEIYNEDPDASVFERLEVDVVNRGRIA